jgi:hypothetical protein
MVHYHHEFAFSETKHLSEFLIIAAVQIFELAGGD